MGLGAARPGTKAAHQGKNWSPSELGNVPGKREVSFSWRSDTESLNGTGGGWLWEGKQGMVITGIPLQLQAALWVHPVRRGAGQRGDETQRGDIQVVLYQRWDPCGQQDGQGAHLPAAGGRAAAGHSGALLHQEMLEHLGRAARKQQQISHPNQAPSLPNLSLYKSLNP